MTPNKQLIIRVTRERRVWLEPDLFHEDQDLLLAQMIAARNALNRDIPVLEARRAHQGDGGMSADVQRLPRLITWGDIQPGDLLRVISISRDEAVVEDQTGVVEWIDADGEILTPDDLVLGRSSEAICVILLGRAGDRWEAVRHG